MIDNPMKLLLFEPDPEEVLLIVEAAAELEESRYRHPWLRPLELICAPSVAEAERILRQGGFHCILMDVSQMEGEHQEGFLRLRRAAPETALVVLVDQEDEGLAVRLVRQGADDYLLKSCLDSLPLAQRLMVALERNQRLRARRNLELRDGLTGLLNAAGFQLLAGNYQALAMRFGWKLMVFTVEITGLSAAVEVGDLQLSDPALLLAAQLLRELCPPGDILGRVESDRLAGLAFLSDDSAEPQERRAALRNAREAFAARWEGPRFVEFVPAMAILPEAGAWDPAAIFQCGLRPLCENDSFCAIGKATRRSAVG